MVVLISALASGRSQAQQSHINGGDSVRVGDTIVTHLAGHTLAIPRGYVSSFIGYAGHVQIHALLPCLVPETAENASEFHKANYGRVLRANPNPFSDAPYRDGQALLDEKIRMSAFTKNAAETKDPDFARFEKTHNPEHRDPSIGPNPTRGSKLVQYDDALMHRDIFVLPGSAPLLVVECSRRTSSTANSECSVFERAPGDLHLWYWYDRTSFGDSDVDAVAPIDARLQRLLESFLTATPKQTACSKTEEPSEGESK
jgi:hypothetical protein